MDTKKQLIEDINKILEKNKEEIIKTVKFNIPKEEDDTKLIVTNFWQLLDNGHVVITIPNIQRNYVQGNNKDIRENFIKDIFQALQEESVINLDIIYGIKEENRFIPIDGQQRLTTLFLLYWYVFVVEKEFDKLQYLKIDYGNRQSSREFFELLLDEEFIKSVLGEVDKQNESDIFKEEINEKSSNELMDKTSISKKIKNNTKFFGAKWNKDITVKSALNMLDEIEKQYKELNNFKLAPILTNKDTQNRICFKCKYLDNSDEIEPEELYIKMNARGKELSKYAILKSSLEDLALKMKKSDEEYFNFCSNMDNKWANKFLNARKKSIKKGDKVNESFEKIEIDYYNILKLYIIFNFIENMLDLACKKEEKDKFITDFLINNSEIKFNNDGICSLNSKFFEKIENLMNKLEFLYSNNPRTGCINEKEIFDLEELLNNIIEKDSFKDISLEDTLYFYALIKFLERDYSEEYMLNNYNYYTNWIRVIRNYVGGLGHLQVIDKKDEASYFKSIRTIRNLAKELDKYPDIIYCFKDVEASDLELSNDNIWLQTEKIKSQYLLSSNKDWNNAILEAEKDAYFYGKNYFLFKYIENITEDSLKLKAFKIYAKITCDIFQNLKRRVQDDENNNNYLLQRAMLTKNNYFKNTNNNIKTFLVSNNSDDTNTWRYELNTDKNEIRNKLKCFIDENILEAQLDNLDERTLDDIFYRIQDTNIEDKFEEIISNYLENINNIGKSWRYYFIKDSNLFHSAQKGNLKFDDNLNQSSEYEDSKDRSINVIKTLRKSTHWDYLTLFLKNYLENEIDNDVKNDLIIDYKGKVGDANAFNHDNTLKLIYKNNVYSFIRNENGDYKIILEDDRNRNFFDVNFDIKVNKEELDNENKGILINEIFGNTKIKI